MFDNMFVSVFYGQGLPMVTHWNDFFVVADLRLMECLTRFLGYALVLTMSGCEFMFISSSIHTSRVIL